MADVLLDAAHETRFARYVLDTTTDRAILVTSQATSAGKFAWSPDGRSIVNFVGRNERSYIKAYRLSDAETARSAIPGEGRLLNDGWQDNQQYAITICPSSPSHSQQECSAVTVTLPPEAGAGNRRTQPRYLGPDNAEYRRPFQSNR